MMIQTYSPALRNVCRPAARSSHQAGGQSFYQPQSRLTAHPLNRTGEFSSAAPRLPGSLASFSQLTASPPFPWILSLPSKPLSQLPMSSLTAPPKGPPTLPHIQEPAWKNSWLGFDPAAPRLPQGTKWVGVGGLIPVGREGPTSLIIHPDLARPWPGADGASVKAWVENGSKAENRSQSLPPG